VLFKVTDQPSAAFIRAFPFDLPGFLQRSDLCNWLAGSLSGQKSPIFRHTSQFFLTIALLWPAKNRFVWRKTGPFLAQTRPANQLPICFSIAFAETPIFSANAAIVIVGVLEHV
jgi:hypothetical protein